MLDHLRHHSRLGRTEGLLARSIFEVSVENVPQLVALPGRWVANWDGISEGRNCPSRVWPWQDLAWMFDDEGWIGATRIPLQMRLSGTLPVFLNRGYQLLEDPLLGI